MSIPKRMYTKGVNMNWQQKYNRPKPNDKIRVIKRVGNYNKGDIRTLKLKFIENGRWISFSSGTTTSEDHWVTIEQPDHGIGESEFEVIK